MIHPKLETERARKQQERNIERSKDQFLARHSGRTLDWLAIVMDGDNFEFVSFDELADLKLWVKR